MDIVTNINKYVMLLLLNYNLFLLLNYKISD